MHNPFLLKNLTSQGFRYILLNSPEQKKEYTRQNSAPERKTALPKALATEGSAPKGKTPEKTFQTPVFSQGGQASGTKPAQTPFSRSPKDFSRAHARQNPRQSSQKPDTPLSAQNLLRQPILPFHAWPEEWKAIHRRCRLPEERPKLLSKQIVWTYAGLEYDLFTDRPSDRRRQLIAQIIKTLSFPKGTHIFLPYRTVTEEGISQIAVQHADNADYSFFWSAVDFIRPRVLVVFGGQTIEELNLPPLLPTQKHTLAPVTVYALDTIMLYAENAKENEIMMNFLKTNLKVFA